MKEKLNQYRNNELAKFKRQNRSNRMCLRLLINGIYMIYSTFFLPPGLFIAILTLFSIKIYKKQRNCSLILIGITFMLYISSTFCFSNWLIHPLESKYQPPQHLQGDVIVMLGGGSTLDTPNTHGKGHLSAITANRLLTSLELYFELKVPIIISGGQASPKTGLDAEIAKTTLLGIGIPYQKIITEPKSINTTENARFTKILIDKYHFRRPILVTSASHMPRAVQQFNKIGIKVIPFPADYHSNLSHEFNFKRLIPTAEALDQTSAAIKEYLGLLAAKWY